MFYKCPIAIISPQYFYQESQNLFNKLKEEKYHVVLSYQPEIFLSLNIINAWKFYPDDTVFFFFSLLIFFYFIF